MKTPFPINPYLTGIVMAYRNREFIADQVLPRKNVAARLYLYGNISLDQYLTVPNTLVGRKGVPNEVEFRATAATASVNDYGLDDLVPIDDIDAARNSSVMTDPLGTAAEGIQQLVDLDREIRVANLVFDPNTYPAANKLAITAKWDDNATDIIGAIRAALASMYVAPNTVVLGYDVYLRISAQVQILKGVFPSAFNASAGALQATPQQLASLFGVQNVLVGQAWKNTAALGKAATVSRVWAADNVAFLYLNPGAAPRDGLTFGWTAQYGTKVAGDIPEPKVGLRGAIRVRVGESVNENITAPSAGFLFTDVLTGSYSQ